MVNVSQIFRLMDVQQHLVQKIITVLMGIDVSIDANPFCARLELDAKMESVSLMYHLMDARQCPVQQAMNVLMETDALIDVYL